MIMDERLEFADATTVALAAGTTVLGDVVDLGTDGVNDVEGMYLVINTDTEVITGGTAGTIQFYLVSDALATLGAAVLASCTQHAASALLVTDDSAANSAALNAGENILVVALPKGQYERYLGVLVTVGTTTVTAGKVNAFLTRNPPTWKAFDSPAQA